METKRVYKLDSVFNSSKLWQVHTGDQSVLPTPRHSFVALSLPRSAQCPCMQKPFETGLDTHTHTHQLGTWTSIVMLSGKRCILSQVMMGERLGFSSSIAAPKACLAGSQAKTLVNDQNVSANSKARLLLRVASRFSFGLRTTGRFTACNRFPWPSDAQDTASASVSPLRLQ